MDHIPKYRINRKYPILIAVYYMVIPFNNKAEFDIFMSNPKQSTIPKVVKLDSDICKRLEKLAQIKHRSTHWMMREAVTRYVAHEEHIEQLNQETLQRWQEAEHGKTVSDKPVEQWIESWNPKQNGEPPCED